MIRKTQITGTMWLMEEEPGDLTHYGFYVVLLPVGEAFPSSVYDLAAFPTEDGSATLKKPLFLSRHEVREMLFVCDYRDFTEDDLSKKFQRESCAADSRGYDNFADDDPYTVVSALRCAQALLVTEEGAE